MKQEVDIVRVDNAEIDGAIPVATYEHVEIHKGRHFFITETNTIASAGTREYLITTPDTARLTHFRGTVSGKYITTIDFYEGTSKTGGTAITAINNYRDSTNTAGTTITHTPSGSGDGTKIYTVSFGDGTNPLQATGGAVTQDDEIVLKRNTKYLLRITSGTNSNVCNTYMKWYEHTINFEAN